MVLPITGSTHRAITPPTSFPTTVTAEKFPAVVGSMRDATVIVGGLTAPPTLITPTVITEDPSGNTYNFGDAEDYRFDIPLGADINGAVEISGGRNGRIIGGKFLYTGAAPGTTAPDGGIIDWEPAPGITSTLFVEGLHLDSNGIYMDLFRINNSGFKNAEMVVQNCYGEGIAGEESGVHADFIECFAGIDKVTLEQITYVTAYAGIFLPYRGSNDLGAGKNVKWGPKNLALTRVNVRVDEPIRDADSPNLDDQPQFMMYLQDGRTAGITHGFVHDALDLIDVYCETRAGRQWENMVFPVPGSAVVKSILHAGPPEFVTFDGGAEMNDTGVVTVGPPPGGDFVDPADVGRNYVSPWPI